MASVVGLARMGLATRRFLRPDPAARPVDVRVVIPARDEAAVIGACVAAVVGQATEVVVVDDGSADGTGPLAAAAGARVVRLDGDPPAGWMGKPRACLAGATGATTEWLAFVDADVVLQPSALATMAGAGLPHVLGTPPPPRAGPGPGPGRLPRRLRQRPVLPRPPGRL